MPASLVCIKGHYAGQEFSLDEQGIVIGRNPGVAGIVLDFPFVSRSHVSVTVDSEGRVIVRDLDSKNGTYLFAPLADTSDPASLGKAERLKGEKVVQDRQRFSIGADGSLVFEVQGAARDIENEATVGASYVSAPQKAASPSPSDFAHAVGERVAKTFSDIKDSCAAAVTSDAHSETNGRAEEPNAPPRNAPPFGENQRASEPQSQNGSSSQAIGICGFVLGVVAIFILPIVILPFAIILSAIAVFDERQRIWGICGFVACFIAAITSPMIWIALHNITR
ncbi:hypothetical protein AGMMS50276_09250 [Synergistales bacterium]|nr:hypothetical protein AGMMS50276_09250 [Synergistales bacterium]